MIFLSPDKNMELHSPIYEESFLVIRGKNEKIVWTHNVNVRYVFSNPLNGGLFTVGDLGDSGTGLGVVIFYTSGGNATPILLRDYINNLEEISKGYRDGFNFPWITAIGIRDDSLLIWVCDAVLAEISLLDFKVKITILETKPEWVTDDVTNNVLSHEAKKKQWQLLPE
jgi:hypothetical protein